MDLTVELPELERHQAAALVSEVLDGHRGVEDSVPGFSVQARSDYGDMILTKEIAEANLAR